ncbi:MULTISPECIES: VOC family protein [Thalassospira]|uniref:Glyoxalase n=2 Tax=Thalassospira TaxID=168934 RepID=A0A367WAR6_9PROT|nr:MULTISPECIES: VOC family protein [Thalassospira]MDG4720031.1 VOC family protein [Thalassospira sp. FZY0004]RCK38467.1 glyoxalase [Thalassospira profundimaris]
MSEAILEHVNFTVSDPAKTAQHLYDWFGWEVRWKGPSIYEGQTYHVGGTSSYVALYSPGKTDGNKGANAASDVSYQTRGGLNHIAVVVDDLDATEEKIKASGFNTHNHADYEPGRRFYFRDADNIEFEVVSYR